MPELIDAFSLENISKSPALFDPVKLKWMNGEYIKALPFKEFCALAAPWYEKSAVKGKYDYSKLSKLCLLYTSSPRLTTLLRYCKICRKP